MQIKIALTLAILLSACSVTIKEGGPAKVDPLTRKEYKVEPR